MSVTVPNALALTGIADGSSIVASDHRNNYAAVQVGVNGLIAMYTNAATKGDLIVSAGGGAFDRLGVGTNGQAIIADSTQALGMKWAAPAGSLTTIFDVVVGRGQSGDPAAPAATIDSNTILGGGIPATYKHLLLMANARGDNAVTQLIYCKLNNDATIANYNSALDLVGNGTAASSSTVASTTSGAFIGVIPGTTSTAGYTTSTEIKIPDYTGTTFNKQFPATCFYPDADIYNVSPIWKSTAIVTRITLTPAAGNFIAGSRFTLYGLS